MNIPTREQARRHMGARSADRDTICDVHRALWRELQQLPPEARERAEELLLTAYIMGKKMAARLLDHYNDAREGY